MAAIPLLAASLMAAGCAPSTTPTPTASATTATSPSATVATPTPNQHDAYPVMAALQGRLVGTWNNTTFNSTGTITWNVTADPAARTVTILVTLTGSVFGGSPPPPDRIELAHLAQGLVRGTSPNFGTVNGTISPDGTIHVILTSLPNPMLRSVNITGTVAGGSMVALAYTVTFSNGSTANGTVAMHK